jgi:hypothetical protein
MASTLEQWKFWYSQNHPEYTEEQVMAGAVSQVNAKNTVPTASQQNAGTKSASQKANDALLGLGTLEVTGKSVSQGGIPAVGVDASGNIIKPKQAFYTPGQEYDYLNGLPPKERESLQKQMFAAGLYPAGFKPNYGYISPSGEDYDVVKRLKIAGAQLGLGDVRDVLAKAQKDPNIKKLILPTSTSGTVQTTTLADAEATLNKYYLDMFNEKASKEEQGLYKGLLNKAEIKAKGRISSQQAEDILLQVASAKANKLIESAASGDIAAKQKIDSGQIGKTVRLIRNEYINNGLTVDDSTVYKKAVAAMRSDIAYDNVVQGIRLTAKNIWKPLAAGIDQGLTVLDQLDTYMTIKSNLTGVAKNLIKISDMTDVMDEKGNLRAPDQYKAIVYNSDAYKLGDPYKYKVLQDTTSVFKNFGIA